MNTTFRVAAGMAILLFTGTTSFHSLSPFHISMATSAWSQTIQPQRAAPSRRTEGSPAVASAPAAPPVIPITVGQTGIPYAVCGGAGPGNGQNCVQMQTPITVSNDPGPFCESVKRTPVEVVDCKIAYWRAIARAADENVKHFGKVLHDALERVNAMQLAKKGLEGIRTKQR